jgi:hypothetical protein
VTTIKAACPLCGEVELTAADIALRLCAQRESLSRYEFICPCCFDEVHKPAPDHIAELLIRGGVTPEQLEIPAEALEEHVGPPISYDDLLDFHMEIEHATNLAERAIRDGLL